MKELNMQVRSGTPGHGPISTALSMVMLMVISAMSPIVLASPLVGSTDDGPVTDSLPQNMNGVEKNMTFYLHYIDDNETSKTILETSTWYYMDTTQDWSPANQTIRVSAAQQKIKFYLYPVLAHDVNITYFDMIIWGVRVAGAGNPQKSVSIYEKDEDGETLVHSNNLGAGGGLTGTPSEEHYDSAAAWGGHTFKAGNSIVIQLDVNPGAGNTFDYIFDTASADSRVVFETPDSMDVDTVYMMDSEDQLKKDLDPTATNKSVRIRANVTDPYGGYDVKWVNLTLEDPSGTVVLDNVTMSKVQGNPKSYLNVYERAWNYSGFQSGLFNVTIWAVDNNGYFYKYYEGQADFDSYYVEKEWNFTIGEITFLNIKVVDSMNVVLPGAHVVAMLNDTKVVEGTNVTNATGMVNMSLFSARYEIRVFWQDTLVNSTVYDLVTDVPWNASLLINASVYYPDFEFRDGHGVALANASVVLVHPNGTTSSPIKTNTTGEFNLTQVAGGVYHILVRWRDVEVNNTFIDIVNNTEHVIDTNVHYMTVIARDNLGYVLPGAQIVIANNTTAIVFDSKVTNLTGAVVSRLPAGPYDVTIYWQNSVVFSRLNISFRSDMTIDAYSRIFVLNITALDAHLEPVPKARILVMTTAESVIESNFTNENGLVRSRLPQGTHLIQAYWRDVLVNETTVFLDDNHDISLALDIHYPTVRVLDDEGNPLSNARVDLYYSGTDRLYGTKITDDAGEGIYRLPATTYDVRVIWHDRLVNETTGVVLDSDDVLIIAASVFKLDLRVEDPHGEAVDNAMVEVSFSDGTPVGVFATDENGSSSVMLPVGTFNMSARWYGVLVAEETMFSLDRGSTLVMIADIYYVNVTPLDSRNLTLEDALVSFFFADGGERLTAGSTGTTGSALFRLPVGTYNLTVVWEEHLVYNESARVIAEDEEMDLDCRVYYLSISVWDSADNLLEGVSLKVLYAYSDEIITTGGLGEEGYMEVRLPIDSYVVEAYWLEVLVNRSAQLHLGTDMDLRLDAAVYYLSMTLVDSRDLPLADATVTSYFSSDGREVVTTSTTEEGLTVLRLPGSYPLDLRATWSGVEILNMTGYLLEGDLEETFQAEVYYLSLDLLDSQDTPVRDVHVLARLADRGTVLETGTSSVNGTLELRLPATEYRLEAVWWGVDVHSSTITIMADTQETLVLDISYLTIQVTDSRNVPVVDAWINLILTSSGSTFGAGHTDSNGTLVVRLPHETYSLTAFWSGVQIATVSSIQLDGDMEYGVEGKVYYLDILVRDDRQLPVEDSLVRVARTDDISLEQMIPTGDTGDVTFRLPGGSYSLEVTWRSVVVSTGLEAELIEDVEMNIDARIFYLSLKVKDSEGGPLEDVKVRVEDLEGGLMGETDTDGKGRAEFRLPVGSYTVRSRLVTTYMMSEVDMTEVSEVELTSSVEEKVTFSEYPIPIHETNTFLVAVLSVVLIAILVLIVLLGLKRRSESEATRADLEEYPPEGEGPEDEAMPGEDLADLDEEGEIDEADTDDPGEGPEDDAGEVDDETEEPAQSPETEDEQDDEIDKSLEGVL